MYPQGMDEKTIQNAQERNRRWVAEEQKKWEEEKAKIKARQEAIPEEQRPGYAIRQFEEELIARGEIVNPFIRQHLEAEISISRWILAIAMLLTLLIEGQWVLWIIFIIAHRGRVKKLREDHLKADRDWRNRK